MFSNQCHGAHTKDAEDLIGLCRGGPKGIVDACQTCTICLLFLFSLFHTHQCPLHVNFYLSILSVPEQRSQPGSYAY
jgi:hypothetical protein